MNSQISDLLVFRKQPVFTKNQYCTQCFKLNIGTEKPLGCFQLWELGPSHADLWEIPVY